jgi:DNA-directed RNA polymerase specialized sigma24 family protein
MNSPAFEEVFPMVRDLAQQKALYAVGRCGLTPDDREDVASQLVITFYLRFGKFDGRRASMRTFASRVMDKELGSILRYRTAGRRQSAAEEPLPDDPSVLVTSGACQSPSAIVRRQFWLDVEGVLAAFPGVLLDTARSLCWNTPSELSRMPGHSRTVVYRRMRRLRAALVGAGIGPGYFASAGGSQ